VRNVIIIAALACALISAAGPARAEPNPQQSAQPAAEVAKPPDLDVNSPSCILLDHLTGEVLYEKNADERRSPASLTKIMTLVLALEAVADGRIKMDDRVTASEEACTLGGSQVWTEPGETHPLRDWLAAVAVGSANDASVVVAEYVAGSEAAFVELMNRKAEELGMSNTRFKNSHGLDEEGHFTTARDTAILSRYAANIPGLLDLTKIYRTTFRGGKFGLDNANKMLVFYDGCDGLKTGSTSKAGYCVANTALRDGKRFIAVVMGAEDTKTRFADSTRLLNYAFATYHPMLLAKQGEREYMVKVWKGETDSVHAVPEKDLAVVVKKGEQQGITQEVELPGEIVAPVVKGDRLGRVAVLKDGKPVAAVNLVAAEGVRRKGIASHFISVLKAMIAF
jgi:D-alanyl-D-alanine carboxypeptidase (penicillin-binding protein 5/6)